MRIYGSDTLPPKLRTDLSHPDVGDIKTYGRGCGTLPTNKEGDCHGYWRNKESKARARRILKRAARVAGKAACHLED